MPAPIAYRVEWTDNGKPMHTDFPQRRAAKEKVAELKSQNIAAKWRPVFEQTMKRP